MWPPNTRHRFPPKLALASPGKLSFLCPMTAGNTVVSVWPVISVCASVRAGHAAMMRPVGESALSVINADIDFADSLDRPPNANEAGFHHKAIARAERLRGAARLLDFDQARQDMAEFIGRPPFDRMGLAGGSPPRFR